MSTEQLFDFDPTRNSEVFINPREISFLQLSEDINKLLKQLNVLLHQALINFAHEKYEDLWESKIKLLEAYRLKIIDGIRLARSLSSDEKCITETNRIEGELNRLPTPAEKKPENKALKIAVGVISLLILLLLAWLKRNE